MHRYKTINSVYILHNLRAKDLTVLTFKVGIGYSIPGL